MAGKGFLLILAIIIWHMYGVHIKRFNKSMFTGKMSEDEMLHEHPLELADIKAGLAERPVDPAALRKRQRIYIPIAAVLGSPSCSEVFTVLSTLRRPRLTTIQKTGTNRGSLCSLDAHTSADANCDSASNRDTASYTNGNSGTAPGTEITGTPATAPAVPPP